MLTWSLANPFGIQVTSSGDIWNSGCVRDVLATDPATIVVATDTGGLWLANEQGEGSPLADMDPPNLWCLARDGPASAHAHLYAGGAALWETDVTQKLPLLSWRRIEPLTDDTGAAIGTVYRIEVLEAARRVVLGTSNGIYWSEIPASSGAGNPYLWRCARGLDPAGYYGLALGKTQVIGDTAYRTVLAASWGRDSLVGDFFIGRWQHVSGPITRHDQLVFQRASFAGGGRPNFLRATSMSVSEADWSRAYAVSAERGGTVGSVWRSDDGGETWTRIYPRLLNTSPQNPTFWATAGEQGTNARPNNCIAASPIDPDVVVIGWRHEGVFVSADRGETVRVTDETPHVHSDIHAVSFDTTDGTGTTLYVGGDGGVVRMPALGAQAGSFVSMFNRSLATLQFQSSPGRAAYGTFTPSTQDWVIAGGAQDNGDLYSVVAPNPAPWQYLGPADDGHNSIFVPTGAIVFDFDDGPEARHAPWDIFSKKFNQGVIIKVRRDDPLHRHKDGLRDARIEPVRAAPRTDDGPHMYAVAGTGSDVFGLYSKVNMLDPYWDLIVRISVLDNDPVPLNDPGYFVPEITAVASYNGDVIFAGSQGGRLFRYSPHVEPGVIAELGVPPRWSPNGDKDASIDHIAVDGTVAFASFNKNDRGHLLRIGSQTATHADEISLPTTDVIYGIELFPGRAGSIVVVATDRDVFFSDTLGRSWQAASTGLPRVPHCSDVRFAAMPSGERWLYLATYGRSVWRAEVSEV